MTIGTPQNLQRIEKLFAQSILMDFLGHKNHLLGETFCIGYESKLSTTERKCSFFYDLNKMKEKKRKMLFWTSFFSSTCVQCTCIIGLNIKEEKTEISYNYKELKRWRDCSFCIAKKLKMRKKETERIVGLNLNTCIACMTTVCRWDDGYIYVKQVGELNFLWKLHITPQIMKHVRIQKIGRMRNDLN